MPGAVPMISNAGRTVCAVVCAAPDTMPSTMPLCTSMVPKYDTSWMISRACSTVTPFLARSCAYCSANWSHRLAGARIEHRSAVQVDAEFGRASADLALVAEDGQVGDTTLQQSTGRLEDSIVVTLRQHDALAIRAGSLAQLVGEHLRRGDLGDRDRQLRQQIRIDRRGSRSAAARCRSCAATWWSRGPGPIPPRLAVSKVPSVVAMIGSRSRSPATSAPIDRCNSNPPLRMMHDSDGNPSAACALATASTTSERSPGVTTADGLPQPLQHMVGRHAGDHHPHHFAVHQRGVTADQGAVHRGLQIGHRRRHQQRLIRHGVGFRRERAQRLGDRGQLRWLATVGHHGSGMRVLCAQLGQAHLDGVGDLLGAAVLGPHRQHHRRAEVDRDPRVDAQLARGWPHPCSRYRR